MSHHAKTNGVDGIYDDNQNIENASPEKQLIFYKKRYEDLQTDFEEFQVSSRELENELETQLTILEKRVHELESKNQHLITENDLLRNKFDKVSNESRNHLADLQKKLEEVTSINDQLTNHIRDLEQSNDDLERAKRHLDATLSEFDGKLNEQIERNELLESEIGEKEELQVVIQRLKDEARDLRLELMIQQSFKNKKTVVTTESDRNHGSTSNETKKSTASPTVNNSVTLTNGTAELKNHTSSPTTTTTINSYNTPKQASNPIPLLSASSRISALNIVSDLLRKVGALESKLASCRSIVPVSAIRTASITNSSTMDNSSGNASMKDINANV